MLKAPFPWFGGKSRAASLIWDRLGNVSNYVEPFAGSLAVLLARPHEPRIETVNDLDCYVSNFWRSLQQAPNQVARWADWPVNECDLHARHKWLVNQSKFRTRMKRNPDYFNPKVAGWWVWGISQWIGSGWCQRPEWEGRAHCGRFVRGIHAEQMEIRPDLSSQGRGVLTNKRPLLGNRGRGVVKTVSGVHQTRPHLSSQTMGVHQKRANLSSRTTPGVHRQLPSLYGRKGVHARRAWIIDWMYALADRLRDVRVCCGDWKRVITPSVTHLIGGSMLTGVLLDPPYSAETGRDQQLYAVDCGKVAHEVREWAIANGDNPLMRIALCGYEGEHEMPGNWSCVAWKANGGYGNAGDDHGRENAARERIWFSPHCLKPIVLFTETDLVQIA